MRIPILRAISFSFLFFVFSFLMFEYAIYGLMPEIKYWWWRWWWWWWWWNSISAWIGLRTACILAGCTCRVFETVPRTDWQNAFRHKQQSTWNYYAILAGRPFDGIKHCVSFVIEYYFNVKACILDETTFYTCLWSW